MAKDSPHLLVILHEMFLHAASEGWKEAEQVVCQGCHKHMPRLDPEAGIPTIHLVHLEIDREQQLELYLEVYKLHSCPVLHQENWPFWMRYHQSYLVIHRRRRALPMPEDHPALKASTHPRTDHLCGNRKT